MVVVVVVDKGVRSFVLGARAVGVAVSSMGGGQAGLAMTKGTRKALKNRAGLPAKCLPSRLPVFFSRTLSFLQGRVATCPRGQPVLAFARETTRS